MEEKRRDSIGTPPPPGASSDGQATEHPTSRRRGGSQKRKSASINSVGSGSTPQTTSSKRQTREKPPPVPFSPIHMTGPCTRARVQPYNSSSFAEVSVKSEVEAREAAAKVEEIIRANENWQALEAKIQADYEAIRSRDASVHVVPSHAGWFSWTKIHPLEEMLLPSFFDGKSESRTSQIYQEIRNSILTKFHTNPNEQIELKHMSEITVGELDARQEVLAFLDYWGLINYHPFPQQEPTVENVDPDADKDEAEKMDLLVEKLFKFETVQPWTPVIPRMNATMPTASGLVPESVAADELVRSEEPPVEYHCNSCSADCSRKRYHCQKQADFDLCADCFNNGKFGSDMSPSDFIVMEPGEAGGASGGNWTVQETLLLLEGIELFRDNWSEIAEHVATKTKSQCILHFVQMPIEDAFFNHDDEAKDPLKEIEAQAPVSTNTENSAPKADQGNSTTIQESPLETESQGVDNNQDQSCRAVISKPDVASVLDKSPEVGESFVLKALREAFEAVGTLSSPGEELSFAEAGNPVMTMASFLVRLVDPNVATATVHSHLKALSGNTSSEQLAARHCFPLQDPPEDEKNLANSECPATGHEGDQNDKPGENQDETPGSVVNGNVSHDETDKNDSAPVEHGEKTDSALDDQKPVSSLSGNHEDKSNTVKESGETATCQEAQPVPSENELAPKATEDLISRSESETKPVKESECKEDSESKENQKNENATSIPETAEANLSTKSSTVSGKENNADDMQTKDGNCKEKETQDGKDVENLKKAAVTALSAAAVKAKFLADQEEEEILKLTTMLIEKQLYKLETKLAFFHEMDNVVMRVKEQLDRSKQKLFHERAQIIATRFGARPNAQGGGAPLNRPPFPNSAPRPMMGGMNSFRPPFPRPVMQPNPTATSLQPGPR